MLLLFPLIQNVTVFSVLLSGVTIYFLSVRYMTWIIFSRFTPFSSLSFSPSPLWWRHSENMWTPIGSKIVIPVDFFLEQTINKFVCLKWWNFTHTYRCCVRQTQPYNQGIIALIVITPKIPNCHSFVFGCRVCFVHRITCKL